MEFITFMFFEGIVGLLLGYAGYLDRKYHKVPDLVSSALWLVLMVAGMYNEPLYQTAVVAFACIFAINVAGIALANKITFGWADVLVFPVYMAFLYSMWGLLAGMIALVPFFAVSVIMYYTKKPQPLVPFLAITYFVWLFFYL